MHQMPVSRAPSIAAYCDIGETTMRLRAVSPRKAIDVNSSGAAWPQLPEFTFGLELIGLNLALGHPG